jgi:hypothetical protein
MMTVYTRHSSPCLQHDSLSHDCECPKWIRGVLPAHGRIRVSARTRSLQEAEDRSQEMKQTDAFEISSVEQAIKLYLADHPQAHTAEPRGRHERLLLSTDARSRPESTPARQAVGNGLTHENGRIRS